jgi:hypothetical protein
MSREKSTASGGHGDTTMLRGGGVSLQLTATSIAKTFSFCRIRMLAEVMDFQTRLASRYFPRRWWMSQTEHYG